MRRFSIYIILTGILLVLSSCVPVVQALYKMAFALPPEQHDLRLGRSTQIDFRVDKNSEITLSISLEFARDGWGTYAVPYSYNAKSNDITVQEGSGIINRDGLDTRFSVTSGGNSVLVEKRFPTIILTPEHNDLTINIKLDQVPEEKAILISAQANIHRDPPRFKLSFISTVIVWIVGILLALIGAIQWIQGIATVPVQSASMQAEAHHRLWIMFCHLGALLGYVLPFGHIVAPLIIWMTKRNRIPGVDKAGLESLNFQLTVTLLGLVSVMLSVMFIGVVLLFVIVVFHVAMTLRASLKAQGGIDFVYPLNIRMIKRL